MASLSQADRQQGQIIAPDLRQFFFVVVGMGVGEAFCSFVWRFVDSRTQHHPRAVCQI